MHAKKMRSSGSARVSWGTMQWVLALLSVTFCVATVALVFAILGWNRGGDAQSQNRALTATVTALQIKVLQLAAAPGQNASNVAQLFPSAAVEINTGAGDGYGMVFHTTEEYATDNWFILFNSVLWDDASYWNPSAPAYFFINVTGRYAVALDCPNVGYLPGHTASGRIQLEYFDNTPGYADCATNLAVQTLSGGPPPNFESVPGTPNAYAVSLYAEAELTATGTSAVGAALNIGYSPFVDATTRPEISNPDTCTMYIRYLGPAMGTPLVPVVCF